MRVCLQRVSQASVTVAGQEVGRIGPGLVALLGIAVDDTKKDAELLCRKVVELRIFEDEQGKMNRSLLDQQGELLVVSQFTLLADCRKGRGPSFTAAAPPDLAEQLYEYFVQCARQTGLRVATGVFRAMMDVALVNTGPVTILLDTRELGHFT